MTRWEPNAHGRLAEAALELFGERGYDETTVQDIAARAGVTKRTFFRHFADKREVLFGGGDDFKRFFVESLVAVPPETAPLAAMAATLDTVAAAFHDHRERSRRRHSVIAASAELRERELVKLASVAAALAQTLRERGVPEPTASVTADAAVAIFRNAFDRWVAVEGPADLTRLVREGLDALRGVAAG